MLQLKRILTSNIFQGIYRNYVSTINISANKVKLIKLKPDEYEDSQVRVEIIDGDKNLIKIDDTIAKITQNEKEFNMECINTQEDTTVIVEVPLGKCSEMEVKIRVMSKGDIKVHNLPTAKSISAITKDGKIKLLHCRSEDVYATANNITAETVYAYNINLKAEDTVNIQTCQSDILKVESSKLKLDSCYSNMVNIKTSNEALLKNLHGNCIFDSSGKIFNTVGFAGTMNGKLKTEKTMLHFVECVGDSVVEIDHEEGLIRAGFANEIVKESTNIHIESNCEIKTKSKEFIVCQKSINKFEVIRDNPNSDSTLKMIVKSGKELQLVKQSWIDSITFDY